jgi:hypothetical protein
MVQFKVLTCFWDSLLVTSFFWLSKVPLTHAHLNQVPDLVPLSYQGCVLENKINRKPDLWRNHAFSERSHLLLFVITPVGWKERCNGPVPSRNPPTRGCTPSAGLWHGIRARLVGSTSTLSTRDK